MLKMQIKGFELKKGDEFWKSNSNHREHQDKLFLIGKKKNIILI